jgi:tetratricopeptide (TPR) repeat protein
MARRLLPLTLILLVLLTRSGILARQSAPAMDPQKAWALVIGISNYEHAEPLRYGASDAASIAQFLQSPRGGGFLPDHIDILLEGDATREAVLLKISGNRNGVPGLSRKVKEGDTVFIFIAGHGYVEDGAGYFVPANASLEEISAGGVFLGQIKTLIEGGLAQAKARVFLADLCNSGRLGTELTPLGEKIQNLVNEELGRIDTKAGQFLNFLASGSKEYSYERDDIGGGVFTHFLLEGLNGKAAVSPTFADAQTVVRYVKSEVPKLTADQQHPISNDRVDPSLILSYLDRPGPTPSVTVQTSLELRNTDRVPYERVEWQDPRYRSHAVRRLPKEKSTVQIGALPTGDIELNFARPDNQTRTIKVSLKPGENTLDLLGADVGRYRFTPAGPVQVAALGAVPFVQQAPNVPAAAEATLLMQAPNGSTAQLDGVTFTTNAPGNALLELRGIVPGFHVLTLVTPAAREYRFRLRMDAGSQIFDIATGEMMFITGPAQDPALLQVPQGVPANLANAYRNFNQAIWEDRLIAPAGNSAWDFFTQLRDAVPAAVRDALTERMIIAMGNRAQRTVLRYIAGGDVRWSAAVFQEGATLTQRVEQLFETRAEYQAQELFFTGRALIEDGRYTDAIPQLQRAIQALPQASFAMNAIGLAYWKQGLLDQAIQPLQQAIAVSPRWAYPRNILSLILMEQRRYAEAQQALNDTLQVKPDDSTSHHALAQLFLQTGRVTEAETSLRTALDYNPGNAYAYQTYGRLEESRQRPDDAERMYRLAMRLEPDEPAFPVSLAELLRARGRVPEAQQILIRLASSNAADLRVVQAYTALLTAQNRTDEARSVFEKALKIAPKNANLRVSYAEFLSKQHHDKDAEKQYKLAVDAAGSNVFAHHGLASLYLSQGKLPQVERELAAAMKADPRFPASPMLLGQVLSTEKRFAEALDAYKKALDLSVDPDQKQQLIQATADTRKAAAAEAVESAKHEIDRNGMKRAWTILSAGLKLAPEDPQLIDSLMVFEREHPADAAVSSLPATAITTALQTDFWSKQRNAERLWKDGKQDDALRTISDAIAQIAELDLRKVMALGFNSHNDANGIHQLVYRWAMRAVERRNFEMALTIMNAALEKKIFDAVPGRPEINIDSLMISPDTPEPKRIEDFEVQHHPDRRAHEVLAVAYAGLGATAKSEDYLKALSAADQAAVRQTIDGLKR